MRPDASTRDPAHKEPLLTVRPRFSSRWLFLAGGLLALALASTPPSRAATDSAETPSRSSSTQAAAGVDRRSAPAAPAAKPEACSPEIATRAYLDIIRTLASAAYQGRGPGTAGLVKARDYIVARFRKAGLRPAFGDSYTQELPLNTGGRLTRQSLTLTGDDGQRVPLKAEEDYAVRGYSGRGVLAGKLAFVGYGIELPERRYDSYGGDGQALRGAVAVAFRFEPMTEKGTSRWSERTGWSPAASLFNKAEWAKTNGAKALVVVNPPGVEPEDRLPSFEQTRARRLADLPVVHISRRTFRRMLAMAGTEDPNAQMARWRREADKTAAKPVPLTGLSLRGQITVRSHVEPIHNVGGLIPGSGKLRDEVVLLVAHYDHLGFGGVGARSRERAVYAGADDNASGTAGIVLLGERFQSMPRKQIVDRRAIMVVAFSGEERGLVGSRHFASHLEEAGLKPEQITAVVNLDMIGRPRDGRVLAFGTGTSKGWSEVLRRASHEGLGLHPLVGPGASDHLVFVRMHRIPSIHLCTGLHEDYHRPGDTADKIDPNSAGVVRLAGQIVDHLATRPKRLTWRSPRQTSRAFLGVGLQRVPGEQGVGINSVVPGSPAADAGIQPGDRILLWNGQNVQDSMTLVSLIATGKPGQQATVTLLRGDQERELTVKLGKR